MELTVHRDKIIGVMESIKGREQGRASDAGEDRESIGSLLELTGMNKKAFAFVRALDKMPEDKRDDCLRTLTPLLDMMDRVWNGNSTPDMFDADDESPVEADTLPAPSYAAEDVTGADDGFDAHLAAAVAG